MRSALRSHRVRLAAAAVALIAVALIVLLATRPSAQDVLADSPLVGKPAPAVTGSAINGGSVNLAKYRGRYVVLNFSASWCPACQIEEPQLVEFAAAHRKTADAVVLGVVFADSAANELGFARSNGVTWKIANDPAGKIALAYGVADPPESFLIAPNGRVLAEILGGVTASGLDQLLHEAGTLPR
jgi:cytochrome c biogenesis protein CcmG/thiol:disulfide interchange protein DsbE